MFGSLVFDGWGCVNVSGVLGIGDLKLNVFVLVVEEDGKLMLVNLVLW